MKKILLLLFSLLIFLMVANPIFAADKISPFTYEEIVKDNNLPYPGILPDNRFYFLKMVRDKIIGIIISDRLKKIEFDILTANKRLSSGIYLLISGEERYKLAVSTISKGENYFADAISKTQQAKEQGIGVSETQQKLSSSLKAHKEILDRLETKFSGSTKSGIQQEEKKVELFQKTVG